MHIYIYIYRYRYVYISLFIYLFIYSATLYSTVLFSSTIQFNLTIQFMHWTSPQGCAAHERAELRTLLAELNRRVELNRRIAVDLRNELNRKK